MAGLLMVNPKKRGGAAKKRSLAQVRATKKLVALNKSRARVATKSKGRARTATTRTVSTVTRKTNPARRGGGKLRGGLQKNAIEVMKSGAIGSAGAIAASAVTAFLPIPDTLKFGGKKAAIDTLVGVGVGLVVANFVNKDLGLELARGAVTVALHGTMRSAVEKFAPGINLGGADDFGDDFNSPLNDQLLGLDAYSDDGMGAFVDDSGAMGYTGAGYTGSGIEDDGMGIYGKATLNS